MQERDSDQALRDCAHEDGATVVYYDGSCPLCRREIGLYQRLNAREPVEYRDVSAEACALPDSLDRQAAMARFHVSRADGQVASGAAAFIVLWERLPGWRWLARIAGLPGVRTLLELAYRAFLPLRPLLQRLAGGTRE